MEVATKNSWINFPISEKAIQIPLINEFKSSIYASMFLENWLLHEYSSIEFEKIKIGLIERSMHQKWFIYYEDNWLYFHHSFSGYCIFKVKFEQRNDKFLITELWAERDSNIYRGEEMYDIFTINKFLEKLSQQKIHGKLFMYDGTNYSYPEQKND